ncbi:MAG: hypothetical protein GY861_18575 [bacterium]|nr:hypothetical protein [bacterium]
MIQVYPPTPMAMSPEEVKKMKVKQKRLLERSHVSNKWKRELLKVKDDIRRLENAKGIDKN